LYNILFLLSTHIFDFYEAFASFFYCPLASIKCNCIVVICNCFVVDRLLYLFYNVYRDRSVHYAAERSDPVKKYNCLLALLVSVFLLLCACAQRQADQASSPDALSSTPSSRVSIPSSSVPASSVPATSIPASSVPATSVPATSVPVTEPVSPIQLSTDWVTNREIVPFEDRFKEDVPFFTAKQAYYRYGDYWFAQASDGTYIRYHLDKIDTTNRLAVFKGRVTEATLVYEIPVDIDLSGYGILLADGHWAYLTGNDTLLKVDLTTGNYSTVLTQNKDASLWQMRSRGMDTVCIFEVDAENNFSIFYHDLHSDAQKMLCTGTLPIPLSEDFSFTAPETTLGKVTWQMMNPAFFTAVQTELQNPDSQFKKDSHTDYSKYWTNPEENPVTIHNQPFLCIAIQNYYNIPARVKYIYDIQTGELNADYGIIDSCERGSGDYNDHFNYENTWETPLEVVKPDPVVIPNITKLTETQIAEDLADEHNAANGNVFLYNAFGYAKAYWRLNDLDDATYIKASDLLFQEVVASPHYIYGITPENTIVQLSTDGSICNTIYASQNTLGEICYHAGSVYFLDGSHVIRINAITGTYSAILRCDGWVRLDTWGNDDKLYILVVQGLYNQQYFFDPDTGVLREESFI